MNRPLRHASIQLALIGTVLIAHSDLHAQVVEASGLKAAIKTASTAFASADYATAAPAYATVVELDPSQGEAWFRLGYSLHVTGKLDEALEAHLKATEFPPYASIASYNVACVHSLQSRVDESFSWLEKATQLGFNDPSQIQGDADLDNIREDPRFDKLIETLKSQPATPRPFATQVVRACARLAYFRGLTGQVAIDYGQPIWSEQHAAAVESEQALNQRWRFGKDHWTTLDCNVPIQLGEHELTAGTYYLVLEQQAKDKFVLIALDPTEVKAKRLDASQAAETTGGIEIPMQRAATDETSEALKIAFEPAAATGTTGKLAVTFGPHKFETAYNIRLD